MSNKYIYFVQSKQSGNIKIGFTHHPVTRLVGLKQEYKDDSLEFIGLLPGNRKTEADIHNLFIMFRIDGEWFIPSVEILSYIKSFTSLEVPKDKSNMVKVCMSISEEMLKQVDEIGRDGLFDGVGRSELIRRAIEDWLIKQWQKKQERDKND